MYSTDEFAGLESCAVIGLRLPKKKWNLQKRNTGWQKQRNGSNSRTRMLGALSSITHPDSPGPSAAEKGPLVLLIVLNDEGLAIQC